MKYFFFDQQKTPDSVVLVQPHALAIMQEIYLIFTRHLEEKIYNVNSCKTRRKGNFALLQRRDQKVKGIFAV